jgi:hypothetical protein
MPAPSLIKLAVGFLTALAVFFFFKGQILAQVVINEFLPNPSGSSSELDEWVELYNSGEEPVDLSGWKLDDIADGGSSPYQFSSETIAPKGFLVLTKGETGVALNNSGDSVRLLDKDGNAVDDCVYEADIGEDKSLARVPDGGSVWFILENPTRGGTNSSQAVTGSPTSGPTSTSLPTPTETVKATCLVNSPTDPSGNVLTSVKIYVDGQYIHHYAPESLSFGSDCFCDDDKQISCDFGKHTITLEKNGYEPKTIEKEFSPGTKTEVNLVLDKMAVIIAGNTSTPTPTPTSSPGSTLALAATSARLSSDSGEVLGQTATESAFYPLEGSRAAVASSTPGVEAKGQSFWPWVILSSGFVFLFSAAFLGYKRLTP